MTLKSQIGQDLNSLPPEKLAEAYQFISLLKKDAEQKSRFAWKEYVGILTDNEAKALKKLINSEFENLEGEW